MKDIDAIGQLQQRSLQKLEVSRRRPYFDADADATQRDAYYTGIDPASDPAAVLVQLSELVTTTHVYPHDYAPSEQLYPWVDLQPNGHLDNIYSGTRVDPEEVIRDDARIARARADRLTAVVRSRPTMGSGELHREAQAVEGELHFNCEHAVPQSWFGHDEPMRGDLHHLFTCEPTCNSKRGSIPYSELTDMRVPIAACGRTLGDTGFEPFAGKGAVARATLYFLLRYPGLIGDRLVELQRAALPTLVSWTQDNAVGVYEQHRNAAIFEAQGNRNPFVDFPELAGRLALGPDFGTPIAARREGG
jgi:endonuclease G, mitochondrial